MAEESVRGESGCEPPQCRFDRVNGHRLLLDAADSALLGATGEVFCRVAFPQEVLRRLCHNHITDRPLPAGSHRLRRIVALLAEQPDLAGSSRSKRSIDEIVAARPTSTSDVLDLLVAFA